MRGQQKVRPPLFTWKSFTKLTANLPRKTYGQFLVWKNLLKENFKCTKTYQNIRGQKMVRPLFFSKEKFKQIDS